MTTLQRTAQIDMDRTFDPNETWPAADPAHGPSSNGCSRSISKITHQHSDLYLLRSLAPLWVSVACRHHQHPQRGSH